MIIPYRNNWPRLHETAFVAPSADLIGAIEIGDQSSVWFQVVIRGDVQPIFIGARSNIQDHSMLHCTRTKKPMVIGDEVTVGHRVMLHGCTIGNRVLIGMGAILMDDVVVGDDCIIGAGALLTQGMIVPPKSVVMGSPAKVVRAIKPEELAFLPKSAQNYVNDSREYRGYLRSPVRLGTDDTDLETNELGRQMQMGHLNTQPAEANPTPNGDGNTDAKPKRANTKGTGNKGRGDLK